MGVEGGDQELQQYRNAQESDGHQEKIFVSVRLRPLNDKEIQSNDFADWESINNNTILFKNCLGERSMYPNAYTFDRVFGHGDSTRKVYEEAAKEIALSVLNGINSSVFAYGQTSSGKTFTMSGITQYAVADIYDYIDQRKEREFVLKFSAIEIYNELVRDLLSLDTTPLRLLDDPERGTVVEKLTEETLQDKSHLLELIAVCEAQRQTGETTLNETSSRSHQILRLTIESSARQFGGGNSSMLAANVNFVDLAGSERTSQTLATGARLKEGSHINRSLLTLGKVIRTLSKGRNGHIPYRDSKLTRILQNSIGGNARTAIICTMSPAHSHLEQSRNTLLFASCAKEVTTNAQVNVVMSDKALVKQLRKELARLETDLKNMSMVSAKGDVAAVLREKEHQIEKMEKEIKELSRQRDLAQSRVEELLRSTRKKQVSEAQTDDEFNYHRPESREKISWLDDSSEASDLSDYQRLDTDLATSESLQYIDEPKGLDLATQSSDLLANIDNIPLPEESLMQPLNDTILERTPDHPPPVIRNDEDSEDNCKEVHCIEVEEASINKESELLDPVKFSPEEKVIKNDDEFEREYTTISAVEKETEESDNKYSISAVEKETEESDNKYSISAEDKDSCLSNTEPLAHEIKKEMKESHLSDIEPLSNENKKEIKDSLPSDIEPLTYENKKESTDSHLSDTEPLSHEIKKESKPHHTDAEHEVLVKKIKALQRTIDMLVNRNYHLSNLSPSSTDSDRSSSRRLSFNRSRSCKAILTSSPTLEKELISRDATSFGGFDKEMSSEKPKGLPRGSVHGKQSRLCLSVPSIRSAIKSEMERDHVKTSKYSDASNFYSSIAGSNGDAAYESDKQTGYETDGQTEEQTETKGSECSGGACPVNPYMMRVRDCMSEGAISTVQSPLNNWYNDFESQRFKIIELWHACHIPLVHRTYFYLLFKDDPSDKIYIEVELRRLCFIKSRFDQGQKIVMDGQVFTPASSVRALNQEKEMLMRQMNKKIPGKQREALFDRWGIALNSKRRRRQLAQRLWTDTKDMQHIRESADLVAKLIGFVGEGQVPKEMFVGPSVGSKSINRRSYSWKSSMSLVS